MDAATIAFFLGSLGSFFLIAIVARLIVLPMMSPPINKKISSLGTLSGKTREEIMSVLGPPSTVNPAGNGRLVLGWAKGDYRIDLLFDANGVFAEVIRKSKKS
jgi:hypothetical protein